MPLYLWEVDYGGPVFQMLSRDPFKVALAWLATREDGTLTSLPPVICVDNMSTPIVHPHSGAVMVTHYVLRLRDLERQDQGLPRYWHKVADRQERVLAGDRPVEAWGEDDRNLEDDDASEPPWGPPPWEEEWS